MFKLSLTDIKKVYSIVKKRVFKKYQLHDFDNLIKYSDLLCFCVYRFNWIFVDKDIEDLLQKTANEHFTNSINKSGLDKNRIIFYDQIGSIECLGLQYLRALIAADYEILYIFESSTRKCAQTLLTEISSYEKIKIVCVDSSKPNKLTLVEDLRNQIIRFNPSKALIHSPAEGAFGVVLWNSLVGINRFKIVPGDHHFYLGVNCADYFIEYRKFGYTTAVQKREIDKRKIYMLPYYPLVDNNDFKGFDNDFSDKVVIFSAGAPYKIYGENSLYFDILKRIIHKHPNVIILFAGDGYLKPFQNFIEKNNLNVKIKLLGYRRDLNMCVAKSDIYLVTFPISGGLTTQYAAYHSKPILAFTTPNLSVNYVEDVVGVDRDNMVEKITYTDIEEFFDYADKIIFDSTFRISEGLRVNSLLTKLDDFNLRLRNILDGSCQTVDMKFENIDYNKLVDQNIDVENKYIPNLRVCIVKYFRCGFLIHFSFIFSKVFFSKSFIKYFYSKLIRFVHR